MSDSRLVLDQAQAHELRVLAALFFVLMFAYSVYSIGKFALLSSQSVIKATVEMRVIQHNVRCVCPRCGTKGVPLCPQCQVPTYWNGYLGAFVCPVCGQSGSPTCPRCQAAMSWIETK